MTDQATTYSRPALAVTVASVGLASLAFAMPVTAQQPNNVSDPRPPVSQNSLDPSWAQNMKVRQNKGAASAPVAAPTVAAPTASAPVATAPSGTSPAVKGRSFLPPAATAPAQPTAAAPAGKDVWPQDVIAEAQAQCLQLLKGKDIVSMPAPPMKDGECGAPAPIELISVGKNPQVTFSPPVTLTCDMAASLHTWVTRDLQPIAKQHLGAPVIRIDTMSSYSCRNAYGRTASKLSEHGRANAIDIRGFVTASASGAELLADWGMTQRDIQTRIAAAKAQQQKLEAERAIAARTPPPAQPGLQPTLTPNSPSQPPATALGIAPQGATAPNSGVLLRPSVTIGVPGAGGPKWPGELSRLGGPPPAVEVPSVVRLVKDPSGGVKAAPKAKGAQPAGAPLSTAEGRTKFLHAAHASACKLFGTVLGPEANNAHRNHFHLDMARRRNLPQGICE